jgi:hypothetical protein
MDMMASPGAVASPPAAAPSGSAWRRKLADLFGLDLRSLALFRIGLGLLLLGDLAIRATALRAHYTDAGVLPRAVLAEPWPLSPYLWLDSPADVGLLFLLTAAAAVALLLGLCTPLATFACWFLLRSLHARNPQVLQGGDVLFRLMLLWGIFLPLGARWSLDARRRDPPPTNRVASLATAAYLLQVCFVYWFSVGAKWHPIWHTEGSAVYYALNIDQLVTPLGRELLAAPPIVLRLLTYTTLAFEALGPVLLLVPVATGPFRFAAVAGFLLFHLVGLGLCLELGPFSYVCAVAWLALLPGWFWDRLAARVAPGLREADTGSPGVRPARWPWVGNTLAAVFLILVFAWNVYVADPDRYGWLMPRPLRAVVLLCSLDQAWEMFAPFPLVEDGWYVMIGRQRGGGEVDLFRGGGVPRWARPERVADDYPHERWRKYLMNLWAIDNAPHRDYYAAYLCREWNRGHHGDERLVEVRIYFVLKRTLPDYAPAVPEPVLLCTHRCAEEPANLR